MYIARLTLNPRNWHARRDLADPYQLHRTLMKAFPEQAEREPNFRERHGVLHRVEADPGSGMPSVLLQSEAEPAIEALNAQGDYLGGVPARLKKLPDLERMVREGRVFHFRLRANVTRKVDTKSGPDGGRRHGRRVAVRGEEAQRQWLERKGAQHGFEVLSLRDAPDAAQVVVIDEVDLRSREKNSYFSSVLFEGRLRVTDAVLLREAVRCGIGPQKAFGFGLLSLAPVR